MWGAVMSNGSYRKDRVQFKGKPTAGPEGEWVALRV